MKNWILSLAVCSFLGAPGLFPQTPAPKPSDIGPGGFEMTTYYVGFLYRGPKWTPERTSETEALQNAHLANIQKMAQEGKLLVAGPFLDDGDLRGLYIFRLALDGRGRESRSDGSCGPSEPVEARVSSLVRGQKHHRDVAQRRIHAEVIRGSRKAPETRPNRRIHCF